MFCRAIVRGWLTATVLASGVTAWAVTIDLVSIGNPGNAADSSGFGSVDYTYQIGKYEVTAGQYADFLNHKATSDLYGLYNVRMDCDAYPGWSGCNIKRTGTPDHYSYSVGSEWADRPVNLVSFWDACRFVNWLQNGQNDGDTETGTYTLNGYNDFDGHNITRNNNIGAKWCLPSENEWYKAAYHNKDAGLSASYFDSPTGTNVIPGRDMSEVTNAGNNANHQGGAMPVDPFPIDSNTYYTTTKGEFELSDSPYGTFDQGGNVWEWNDTVMPYFNVRGLRGGSFDSTPESLLASTRFITANWPPSYDSLDHGFRVGFVVPEPGSIVMVLIAGGTGLAVYLWRRQM